MNRQQEIIKQVRELMDELESLGTGKGYELDSPWEKHRQFDRTWEKLFDDNQTRKEIWKYNDREHL